MILIDLLLLVRNLRDNVLAELLIGRFRIVGNLLAHRHGLWNRNRRSSLSTLCHSGTTANLIIAIIRHNKQLVFIWLNQASAPDEVVGQVGGLWMLPWLGLLLYHTGSPDHVDRELAELGLDDAGASDILRELA